MTEPFYMDACGRFVLIYQDRAFTYRVIPIIQAWPGDLARWSVQHMRRDVTMGTDIAEARNAAEEWCRWKCLTAPAWIVTNANPA